MKYAKFLAAVGLLLLFSQQAHAVFGVDYYGFRVADPKPVIEVKSDGKKYTEVVNPDKKLTFRGEARGKCRRAYRYTFVSYLLKKTASNKGSPYAANMIYTNPKNKNMTWSSSYKSISVKWKPKKSIRDDAVKACNARLDERRSKGEALHVIMGKPFSLTMKNKVWGSFNFGCTDFINVGSGTARVYKDQPIKVKCLPSKVDVPRAKVKPPRAKPKPPRAKPKPARAKPKLKLAKLKLPDLTSRKGITVGNQFSAWGGTIHVNHTAASSVSPHGCRFRMVYDVVNIGKTNATGFSSYLFDGAPAIHMKHGMAVPKYASRNVSGHIVLKNGTHLLRASIDHTKKVVESNEGNNVFRVTVKVTGNCHGNSAQPRPRPRPVR